MTIYELKKILDLTANKWDLIPEDEIKIYNAYNISTNGYIHKNEDGMLDTTQKISCKVLKNKQKIDYITIIHDGEKGQLLCQAFQNPKKALFDYQHSAYRNNIANEIQNYIDTLIKIK